MVIEISAFNQKSSHGQQKLAVRVLSDHTNGPERERNKGANDTGDVKIQHMLFYLSSRSLVENSILKENMQQWFMRYC